MPVDVTVEITPCLVNRDTGDLLDTTVQPVQLNKQQYAGWNFDWYIPQQNGYNIHAKKPRRHLLELDAKTATGAFTAPSVRDLDMKALRDYCKEKNIAYSDLTEEIIRKFER